MIGLEQVQSVIVHESETLQDHIEEAYHICKLEGKPVLPTVCRELHDIALKEEPSKREAARVLGTSYSTLWNMERRINAGEPYHLKRLPIVGEDE